jgi:hypothetical protein
MAVKSPPKKRRYRRLQVVHPTQAGSLRISPSALTPAVEFCLEPNCQLWIYASFRPLPVDWREASVSARSSTV